MKISKLTVLSVALAAMPMAAFAQDTMAPLDNFFFTAGVYHAENDLDLRIDEIGGEPGTEVDFQRDLGFDPDGQEPFLEIGATLAERHQIKAYHYGYDHDGSATLDETFLIDGEEYAVDAAFDGGLDVDLTGVSYTWFFHRTDHNAFGVGLGAVHYDLDADLAAAAVVGGEGEIISGAVSGRYNEDAWAPMLRAEYVHSLSQHWRVGADVSYVKKSGGSLSGDAIDANARVEYFPWEHVGFALRYNVNNIDLDFDSSFQGNVDLRNSGPQLVATLRF